VSKGIVGLYFNDETMTTRVRNLVFRDPSSTAEKTQRTLEFRVRELDEEEEEDSKKAKPSPSLKRTKKTTRSEIRARVERERKERLVKKMRSVGIVSPSLNNSNITTNLKNKKSITADINETTRARLVDVQREVIEMEEEIARLENNNQMDFRMELETVSRKAELDALKNERDTLIAQLKEQRALMRNEFEDNVRKEKQHMKKMRDLENEQVQKWEQELTRRESESEREREIWESERFEMVKQERLRWEQQLKDRDDEIRKMRLEFQKWQEEMRLRVDEDKRKWMQEHEKRLEMFEKRMRDVFEMDKMEALKQYIFFLLWKFFSHFFFSLSLTHTHTHATTTTTDTKVNEKSSSRSGIQNLEKENRKVKRNGRNNINVLRRREKDTSRRKRQDFETRKGTK
jgi:hypothetical protein